MRENDNDGLMLAAPRVVPPLDPAFRPAALAVRALEAEARVVGSPGDRAAGAGAAGRVGASLQDRAAPRGARAGAGNLRHLERLAKFALWSRGGGTPLPRRPAGPGGGASPPTTPTPPTGRFDAEIVGERIYDHPLEVVATHEPAARAVQPRPRWDATSTAAGSASTSAAATARRRRCMDGQVVWSEETEWDPYHQPDPQYHFDGIMDSLRKAALHLPRVDAIGGSAAGVYVHNQVKFASLFRGVAPERVRPAGQEHPASRSNTPGKTCPSRWSTTAP